MLARAGSFTVAVAELYGAAPALSSGPTDPSLTGGSVSSRSSVNSLMSIVLERSPESSRRRGSAEATYELLELLLFVERDSCLIVDEEGLRATLEFRVAEIR